MKTKGRKLFILFWMMMGLLLGTSSCVEDEVIKIQIGDAGKFVAENLVTGETFSKEMYGQNLNSPKDTVHVNFEETMNVKNGDKIKFSFQPNSKCSKYDLEPILVVNDTSVTLNKLNGYKFEYQVKDFEKGKRYGTMMLIIYKKSTKSENVLIVSVGDFALALKED